MESGVLGNALEGVPEEDAEGNTSQFEDPAKMTDQEKDQVNEVVTEAFEENFKELEEKKAKAEESKKESAKPSAAEGKDGATKNEDKEDGEEEPMDEDEEGTEEEDDGEETGEETDEKPGEKTGDKTGESEKSGEKKDEEEEPSNLQLAWEMLELAKLVYSKQLEAGADNKAHLEERIVSTMLALGEVSIENENYKQAVEDIQECLKKQGQFPKDAR